VSHRHIRESSSVFPCAARVPTVYNRCLWQAHRLPRRRSNRWERLRLLLRPSLWRPRRRSRRRESFRRSARAGGARGGNGQRNGDRYGRALSQTALRFFRSRRNTLR